jgi:hypothetical protein
MFFPIPHMLIFGLDFRGNLPVLLLAARFKKSGIKCQLSLSSEKSFPSPSLRRHLVASQAFSDHAARFKHKQLLSSRSRRQWTAESAACQLPSVFHHANDVQPD